MSIQKDVADELEEKILEIGPEKVSAFIGETIMGGLVGDVPPAENYWKYIRGVCDRYNIHLIIDEVWCGTGTSGKIYCIDWDEISPDFIFLGKTLGAGYVPISAVLTSSEIEEIIKKWIRADREFNYISRSFFSNSSGLWSSVFNSRRWGLLKKLIEKGNYSEIF